jgi:hypothetical protein
VTSKRYREPEIGDVNPNADASPTSAIDADPSPNDDGAGRSVSPLVRPLYPWVAVWMLYP